ncbi:right-handed parallel beta-helix repeat-containing protein [Pontiellaceae bacterium B12227]|nr:right-handed parallel beta-helix repeat-containing protein [Pontiellaceae bacterium B12227]
MKPKFSCSPSALRWLGLLFIAGLVVACDREDAVDQNSEGMVQAVPASGFEIYVSPDGIDTDPGSKERPLKSIQAARDKAAAYLHDHPDYSNAVRIYLRGGVYSLEKPLVFSPEHSGRKNTPIIYSAYKNEKPVISGGHQITGNWQQVPGKEFYALNVPEASEGKWAFNMLYVNGESRTRARTPNYDEKVLWSDGRVPGWDSEKSMRFFDGDIDPTWSDLENIDIVLLMAWTPVHHRVSKIDFNKRGVELASAAGQHQLYGAKHFRYYLSNVYEGLDAPGEWYLDRKTGILYYYPMPGENMDELSVYVPKLGARLVTFQGDAEKNSTISYLEFHGLGFMHTDTDRMKWNGVYRQAHSFLDTAIYAEGLTHSVFSNCEIKNTGEYAFEFSMGCQSNSLVQCHIWDTGGGGVQLGISTLDEILEARKSVGTAEGERTVHPRTDVLHNTIENCIIHKTGTYWQSCYAINNRFASFSKIIHNEIFDTHYTAIAIDARWVYDGENYCHGNEIAYNHLHHIGRGCYSDGAAIYQFGPTDNHIHHNHIHDVVAYPLINAMKGIYFDQQSRAAVAENNLIYSIEGVGLNQNWGINNTYRNNLVAFTKGGASRGKADKPESAYNNLAMYQNVFISNDGVGLDKKWHESKGRDIIRDNLFYDINHGTVSLWGMSMEEWKKTTGHGENTIFADPGCADPENLDFTISKQNEALKKIGFVPFSEEIKKAGVYGDREWISLPSKLLNNIRKRVPSLTRSELGLLSATFREGFEEWQDGAGLQGFRNSFSKDEGTLIGVSSSSAFTGKQSLEFIDSANTKKRWHPSLELSLKRSPIDLTRHRVDFGFAVMLDKDSPVGFESVCRGDRWTDEVGPLLRFNVSGEVVADDKELLTVKPGTWVAVDIQMGKGVEMGKYKLSLTADGKKKEYLLPFKHDFNDLSAWLLLCPDKKDGGLHLDDVYMRTQ